MKTKKVLAIITAICVTFSIVATSFAGNKKGEGLAVDVQLVPEASVSQADIDAYLKSGGVLHTEKSTTGGSISVQYNGGTHYKMASRAVTILSNDKGTSVAAKLREPIYNPDYQKYMTVSDVISIWAQMTDNVENDSSSYSGHFYGADGKNYLGQTSPTAYTRFNNHFYEAVTKYNGKIYYTAYKELGMAVHYLEDLNAPHHASNKIAGTSNHTDYEAWVESNIDSWLINNATSSTYDYMCNTSYIQISNDFSASARATYATCGGALGDTSFKTKGVADTQSNVSRAQRAVAGLFYRFLKNTQQI